MSAGDQKAGRLRVRVYNVLFGDAVLVSVPDAGTIRHVLIDVGNVQSGKGGRTDIFRPMFENLELELAGRPLDLYVMTHEHMDHVKGLLFASEQLGIKLRARYSWLTASSAPDYYKRFPGAAKKKRLAETATDSARVCLKTLDTLSRALMANNDYRQTDECVQHLRQLAGRENTVYVFRDAHIDGKHPFEEAKFKIWAPEEDASDYYGRFHAAAFFAAGVPPGISHAPDSQPAPPAGVDATAFNRLVQWRNSGHYENLLTIDRAANNTSIVFSLRWRGWNLLFPGDAELRSWRTMAKHEVLEPVHFLKVGHHGSQNGTPSSDLLDKILPLKPKDKRTRCAVVSTHPDVYPGVPDHATLSEISKRCRLFSVLDLKENENYLDLFFDA